MLELLAAAAPYLIVAGAFTFVGAGFGYATGFADGRRAPRSHRASADVGPRP